MAKLTLIVKLDDLRGSHLLRLNHPPVLLIKMHPLHRSNTKLHHVGKETSHPATLTLVSLTRSWAGRPNLTWNECVSTATLKISLCILKLFCVNYFPIIYVIILTCVGEDLWRWQSKNPTGFSDGTAS